MANRRTDRRTTSRQLVSNIGGQKRIRSSRAVSAIAGKKRHNINTLYDHSILVLLQYWTKKLNCICWVLPACIVLVRTKPFMANWGEIEVKLKQKRPIWFSVVRPGVAPLQTCKSAAKTRKLASREYKQKWGMAAGRTKAPTESIREDSKYRESSFLFPKVLSILGGLCVLWLSPDNLH